MTFKFSGAPETVHIFGTIGDWISSTIAEPIGSLFAQYGAYATGTVELIASILFLLPIVLFVMKKLGLRKEGVLQNKLHRWAGSISALVLVGALFFHLFTPLGIEVLYQGESDGGALFYSAVIMFVMSIIIVLLNRPEKG